MSKRIAVLGAGAIGSSVGADLTKAGYDVAIIDQWPAHVEAMKAHGLRVVMSDEDLRTPVHAYHLCEVCTLNREFDIVLLGAKSYDTAWMTEFIKPYLKPDGYLGPNKKKARGVVLQDYLKGRYTETDYLSGLVVRKGKEAGVPTPANAAVTAINRRIRAGELRPGRANLALVEEMLR
ncbi:MAG: NAD-binding protein [Betaproteobacteria bacterium]|nr:NAD-binding protein [Betaproteobacteria bacterium]